MKIESEIEILKNVVAVSLFQGKLQKTLISLGQFHVVIDGLLSWLTGIEENLEDWTPVFGDPKLIETELSKLKVTSYTDIKFY